MIKIATLAALTACAAPLAAQAQPQCFDTEESMRALADSGFKITFGDETTERPIFLLEDGNGRWVMLIVTEAGICPILSGNAGTHATPPPNV